MATSYFIYSHIAYCGTVNISPLLSPELRIQQEA